MRTRVLEDNYLHLSTLVKDRLTTWRGHYLLQYVDVAQEPRPPVRLHEREEVPGHEWPVPSAQ